MVGSCGALPCATGPSPAVRARTGARHLVARPRAELNFSQPNAKVAKLPSASARSTAVAVDPSPAVPAKTGAAALFSIALPAAALGLAAALFFFIKRARSAGSVGGLVERGYLDENRHRADPFYTDVMAGVNTVRYEELSEEAIQQARARRSRERYNNGTLSLQDIELPDNHPFATKAPISPEEQQLMLARLKVRRGAPPQTAADLADSEAAAARRARRLPVDDGEAQ